VVVDHRNVGAAFRRLSVPIAVQMLGDQLLGIADTIAIGTLGTVALAGATAANALLMAVLFAIFGLLTGTSIVAAQRIGARDIDGFGRTVRAGALFPFFAAAIVIVLGVFFSGDAVGALVGKLPSAHASGQYLTLRLIATLPIVISGTLIVGLGAAGNRIVGVLVLVVVNLVHIPLLLVLALGFGTHHPLGIAGAGLSSLLSETFGAVCAITYVSRKPEYRIFSSWTISWRTALQSARLGLPETVFLVGVMLPDIFIVGMLASLGATVVSAFRALNVVSDVTFVVPSPLQSAAQTVIGQRLGAGDPQGAREFLARAQRVALAITLGAAIVVAACAWPLAYAFTLNAAVASLAALPLALHMITLPIKGWAMVSLSPIRASGDTRFSMFVGLICAALVIPFCWLGIERLHIGLYSVPLAWIAAWAARAGMTQWKLRGQAWTRAASLAA
jgi:putative MATE family efflux protein